MRYFGRKKGNALLISLGVSMVIAAGVWGLQTLVPVLMQETVKSGDILSYRLALNSAIDYASFSVKQRWCVNDLWIPKNPCDITDPRHTERLMLTTEGLKSLKAVGITTTQLNEIAVTVPLQTITPTHPLYSAFRALPASISGVELKITRLDNVYKPTADGQVFIKIRATLQVGAGALRILKRSGDMYVEALFSYFPRELSSMALVVANDLHLDQYTTPLPSMSNRGDIFVPYALKASNPKGLNFTSPVFINGSIHMLGKINIEAGYISPVLFADKVYLGNGMLLQDGKPFNPEESNDGRMATMNEIKGLYGLRQGIEVDGARDLGLEYLSGRQIGTTDSNLMEFCAARGTTITDLQATRKSGLILAREGAAVTNADGTKTHRFRIGLSGSEHPDPKIKTMHYNEFSPQTLTSPTLSNVLGAWSEAPVLNSGAAKPIVRITAALSDGGVTNSLQAQMGLGSSVSLKPDVVSNLNTQIAAKKKVITDIEATLADPSGSLFVSRKAAQTEMDAAATAVVDFMVLKGELAPSDPGNLSIPATFSVDDADEATALSATFRSKRTAYNSAASAFTTAQNFVAPGSAAQTEVANLEGQQAALVANPPTATIATEPVTLDGKIQPNQFYVAVTLRNENFLPKDLALTMQGYDVAFDEGQELRALVATFTAPDGSTQSRITLDNDFTRAGKLDLRRGTGTTFSPDAWVTDNWNYADTASRTKNGTVDFPLLTTKNFGADIEACKNAANTPVSFAAVSWDHSFAPSTRKSWNFANPSVSPNFPSWNPAAGVLTINATMSSTFQVRSIIGTCRIDPNAVFVAGFYTCDKLEIPTRSKPLRIIGSFIVSSAEISPSAISEGITWSNIYQPQAVLELRAQNILGTNTSGVANCDLPSSPIWNPEPGLLDLSRTFQCSPVALRSKGANWKWSLVDPDQGLISGAAAPSRKNRVQRYLLKEVSRESNI
jgi:hypothetical protein